MRRLAFVLPLLFACSKAETPPADSAAAATPAALSEADVAGTWTGTAMAEGTDSTFAHWTITCASGSCRLATTESPKDTVVSTYVLQADSSVGTSSPYNEPTLKAMVVDHYVARFTGGQVSGTGHLTLADKPDSVVMRYRFSGTKAP